MTKAFEIKKKTRKIAETFITMDGKDFELTDLVNMMEELKNSSYAGPRIVIYDKDLQAALIKRKVVENTVKGSLFRGRDYEKFAARITATYKAAFE
jgi:hypothetical protein